jgi:D-alanyl-lipoteichoic acid acyltransferase DltB (MBOAT superfamily)
MLFNTAQFAIFLAAVVLVYRSLPRSRRNPLLLGASLLFYSLWIPAFLLLLIADIVVNYALLRGMIASGRPRPFLIGSIVFTLGLLAFFKYAAFLVGSAAPFLEVGFGYAPPVPEIFLPLGISFYSFQIVALAIDTYRGEIAPVRSLPRYALYISFFPQLIAGPILRGHEFLPQLERGGEPNPERTRRGLWLLASGIVKKVFFADFLLAHFVDDVFATPGLASRPFHLVAIYSFAFQLYFDFSGYTDMARGMACLLGFELPLNFREPYLARNPAEFWQRWHMTLTRWLRLYLFIPLSRAILRRSDPRWDAAALAAAQLATMTCCGLWHGAGWTFVVWGALCGLMLVVHRRFGRRARELEAPLCLRDLPRILLHFHVFGLLLVVFRSPTFGDALTFIEALFTGGNVTGWPVLQTAIVLLCAALHVLERRLRLRLPQIQAALARPWWGGAVEAAALGSLFGLAVAVSGAGGEFIYFQF